ASERGFCSGARDGRGGFRFLLTARLAGRVRTGNFGCRGVIRPAEEALPGQALSRRRGATLDGRPRDRDALGRHSQLGIAPRMTFPITRLDPRARFLLLLVPRRLGWLVEFVPEISGVGESYARRKKRFLARLYRGVAVLPLTAGLEIETHWEDIRNWVSRRA